MRCDDSSALSQSESNLFPGFDAVVIGFLRKLRDGEMAVLVDDGRLRTSTAQGRSRCEDELEILVGLFVAQDAFGDLQEPAEFNEGRDAGSRRRLERRIIGPAEAKRAETGFI